VLRQLFGPIGPEDLFRDPNVIAQHAGAFEDWQPGIRVDPPRQEIGDPALGVGVARRADVRPHAAGRAVAADHVEELMRRKMRQLIKTEQGDLSALPIIDGAVELQMGKLDLAAARPAPLASAKVRGATEPRIELSALIPQSARIGDLRRGAPEEYRGEVRNPAGMTQGLQDQPDGLPAARSATVDADVGRGSQKLRSAARAAPRSSPWLRQTFALDPGSYRCFLAKYFACASRSTSVNSGSRLLSGRTRTGCDPGGGNHMSTIIRGRLAHIWLAIVVPGLRAISSE